MQIDKCLEDTNTTISQLVTDTCNYYCPNKSWLLYIDFQIIAAVQFELILIYKGMLKSSLPNQALPLPKS